MLITVFKCYFPKRMIMCKVQTNYLAIAETRYYITTTVSYIRKLKVDKISSTDS